MGHPKRVIASKSNPGEALGAFRRLLRDTDPGKLFLAAFLFEETEPSKATELRCLAETSWLVYGAVSRHWPFAPGKLSRLLRDALDKAEYHKLKGLCDALRPLFRSAAVSDLWDLERRAALASGRFVRQNSSTQLPTLGALAYEDWTTDGTCSLFVWWTAENDREVRKRLL